MPLAESCLNIVKIMAHYNLITEKHSNEKISQFIRNLQDIEYGDVYPLDIVPFLNPSTALVISYYDDCNIYQEDNYYVEELRKTGIHSQGHLNFSNLNQDWSEEGIVTLTYTLNGKAGKIEFNNIETRDMVPDEYIEFVKTILDSVSGTDRYLHYVVDSYLVFCLLPIDVANELEAMEANKSIRNK